MIKTIATLLSIPSIAIAVLLVMASQHNADALDMAIMDPACKSIVERISAMELPEGAGNCQVRRWYQDRVLAIAKPNRKNTADDLPLYSQAYCAYSQRYAARTRARELMPSEFEVALLRVRDLVVHGDFDGPDFEDLTGDASPEKLNRVIASAKKTNNNVDAQCDE